MPSIPSAPSSTRPPVSPVNLPQPHPPASLLRAEACWVRGSGVWGSGCRCLAVVRPNPLRPRTLIPDTPHAVPGKTPNLPTTHVFTQITPLPSPTPCHPSTPCYLFLPCPPCSPCPFCPLFPPLQFKIMRVGYSPLPPVFSRPFQALLNSLLRADPDDRPTTTELLHSPFVRKHLAALLGCGGCCRCARHVCCWVPHAVCWQALSEYCGEVHQVVFVLLGGGQVPICLWPHYCDAGHGWGARGCLGISIYMNLDLQQHNGKPPLPNSAPTLTRQLRVTDTQTLMMPGCSRCLALVVPPGESFPSFRCLFGETRWC